MSARIDYSLTAKVYSKSGLIDADYFETSEYVRALERFDRMLVEAMDTQFSFAVMCEVIMTETQYDSDGKAVKSKHFKFCVNEEEPVL